MKSGSILRQLSDAMLLPLVLAFHVVSADPVAKPGWVTPAQLEQIAGERKDLVILDVRTAAERAGGWLPHSINLDCRAADFRDQLAKLDRSKTYVVHCVRGLKRTTDSVSLLNQLGVTNVFALEGGYEAWVKAGKPVEK